MASDVLRLEVVTPSGTALEAEATAVTAPSVKGEFGVLPGHLPLLAALDCGVLEYTAGGKKQLAAIGPGFVEAGPAKVVLLTDMIALPEDIDTAAVGDELKAANEALKAFGERHEGPEWAELDRDVRWAQARLDVKRLAF